MFKPGSWSSIGLIYLYGVLGSASLSKIIPLQQDYVAHLGATAVQFGLLISLLTLPPAFLAAIGGTVIDRVGARRTLIASSVAGVAVNLAYLFASSLLAFQVIRVLEGFVIVGAYAAAPGLIIATAAPERRGPAMAFWSTYTPVGVSLGLAMSSIFAGEEFWRGSYLVHGTLFGCMALVGLTLPQPPRVAAPRTGALAALVTAFTQSGPLRVALTFSALVIMGFGVNSVFPSWYSQTHGVSLAAASSLLAVMNLTMIVGSFAVGFLVARGLTPLSIFVGLAVLSLGSIALLFNSAGSQPLLYASLVVWLVMSGASIAVVSATLPRVVASPAQAAGAAGLLSQTAALATFITPPLWLPLLAKGQTGGFLVIVAVCWALALLLLPKGAAPAASAPRA